MVKFLNKLSGQRVLLIGGTKGIGYGIAEASVEFGGTVFVASSKQESVDNAIKSLKESYPEAKDRVSGGVINLRSDNVESDLKKLFDAVTDGGKDTLDHIVDTSGDGVGSLKLDSVTIDELQHSMQLRYIGMVMIAKVGSQYLKKAYTSSFTVTSGALVYKPTPGRGMLAGVGGAKEGLVRGLAVELAPVRVNLVSPGAIDTSLLRSFAPPDQIDGMMKMFASGSLANRIGSVEDTAEIYTSIMKCGFVTGQVFHVEGGYLLK